MISRAAQPLRIAFLATAGSAALAGSLLLPVEEARADECILDTNDNNNADGRNGARGDGSSDSLACGDDADAGNQSVALGALTEAGGNSAAVGYGAKATGNGSTAFGFQAQALANNSVAIGNGAKVEFAGDSTTQKATGGIAIGASAEAGWHTTTIGEGSQQTGQQSVVIGYRVGKEGGTTNDRGYSNKDGVVSIGGYSIANSSAVAMGYQAEALGHTSIAIGLRSDASASRAIAIGEDSEATDTDAIALGEIASASAGNAMALGNGTDATGTKSIALGVDAQATADGAVAIGTNSVADVADTVSFGRAETSDGEGDGITRQLTYVADGTEDHHAATKGQLDSVSTSLSNSISSNTTAIASNLLKINVATSDISTIFGQLSPLAYDNSSNYGYASASGADSVALGRGSVAAEELTVSLGRPFDDKGTTDTADDDEEITRRLTYVADGVDDHDAATVGQIADLKYLDVNSTGSAASALGSNGIALGPGASVASNINNSIAIGSGASVYTTDTAAVGGGNIAIGNSASVYNDGGIYLAIAIGNSAQATVNHAVALGYGAEAHAYQSLALGSLSVADESQTVSFGRPEIADDPGTAEDESQTGITRRLTYLADGVDDHDAATVGQLSTEVAALETAISNVSSGSGSEYIGLNISGASASATGENALAMGDGALAQGISSIAIGGDTVDGVDLDDTGAQATGHYSMALGGDAEASGALSFALGPISSATASNATAIGTRSVASGINSLALGTLAQSTGLRSAAVGPESNAAHDYSMAIGYLAATTRANQIVIGTSSLTLTLPGVAQAASNAAQSGELFYLTTDANGNIGFAAIPSSTSTSSTNTAPASIAAAPASAPAVASNQLESAPQSTSTTSTTPTTPPEASAPSLAYDSTSTDGGPTSAAQSGERIASAETGAETSATRSISDVEDSNLPEQVALEQDGDVSDLLEGELAQSDPDQNVPEPPTNPDTGAGTRLASTSATGNPDLIAAVTEEQFNTLAGSVTALDSRVTSLENRVDTLFDLTETIDRDARRGIASIAAQAHPHFPSEPGKTSYASNVATYRGEVGVSLGLMHRFEGDFAITAGVTYAGGNSTSVRAGVAGEF